MMDVKLKRTKELTPAELELWLDIQERAGVYDSPYFRSEFTRSVAAVRDDVEIAVIVQDGQTVGFFPFQRGKLNLGKPVGGKLSDYHGPILRQTARLDPQALLQACKLASWDFDHLVSATPAFESYIAVRDGSPQLDLSEGFGKYCERRREAGNQSIHRQRQKTRKLIREVGPLDFMFDSDDEEAFTLLRTWKSAQYLRTGLADVFAFPWTLGLIRTLREHRGSHFSSPLSVLRAGGRVAAVCLSLRSRGVLHSWFNAYNPELHAYSPGLTLFLRLAEEAPHLGIRKIDLGRGEERYKSSLATNTVELGEGSITTPSLATWLRSSWRQTRDWVNHSSLAGTARLPGRLLKPIRHWLAYQ
jgi:CelD/BcsL family acetyltransferase involved in cellulose biosynthesis